MIDLTTGQVVALLRFETAVQEVFAVTVLPGRRYPDLINDDEKLLENSFVVPDAALADVSAAAVRLTGPCATASAGDRACRTSGAFVIGAALIESISMRFNRESKNMARTSAGGSGTRRRDGGGCGRRCWRWRTAGCCRRSPSPAPLDDGSVGTGDLR